MPSGRITSPGALVLVAAIGLDCNVFPKGEVRGGLLGALAEGLAFLHPVDATETDAFRVVIEQDFDRVAVEDPDDFALILRDNGGLAAPRLTAARNNLESRAAFLPLQRITPPV